MSQKKQKPIRLKCCDCLDGLKLLKDNSVDTIITDPPYGLSKQPDIAEVMRHWIAGTNYDHKSAGFMGKSWDSFVPCPDIWKECLRVLKPGGFALVFASTRTSDLMSISLRFAGFEIRDTIMWLYGSGFPKSLDISKAIDKAPATPEAETWSGYGTALKPACEPIIVAMKPLEGTFAQNALKHGVAGLNIDGGRIGTEDNLSGGSVTTTRKRKMSGDSRGGKSLGMFCEGSQNKNWKQPQGRFPANVILDSEAGALLDEQSGISKSSRFFYCAKASRSERNFGCEGLSKEAKNKDYRPNDDGSKGIASRLHGATAQGGNSHPTVKPIKLMEYLCRLTRTPTGGVVLDPFMGSGTTALACLKTKRRFIGFEISSDYYEIAKKRITKIIQEMRNGKGNEEKKKSPISNGKKVPGKTGEQTETNPSEPG